jgi:hypothetical protein
MGMEISLGKFYYDCMPELNIIIIQEKTLS